MLVRLLYASRAIDPASAAIDEILLQSRQGNPSSGISGGAGEREQVKLRCGEEAKFIGQELGEGSEEE